MSAAPTLEGDIGEPVAEAKQDPLAERRDVTDAVVGSLMLAFDGLELPSDVADRLASAPAAGVTLFRFSNVADPGQIRSLTAAIQAAAARPRDTRRNLPLLIAADQECGQLIGLGEGTTTVVGLARPQPSKRRASAARTAAALTRGR